MTLGGLFKVLPQASQVTADTVVEAGGESAEDTSLLTASSPTVALAASHSPYWEDTEETDEQGRRVWRRRSSSSGEPSESGSGPGQAPDIIAATEEPTSGNWY